MVTEGPSQPPFSHPGSPACLRGTLGGLNVTSLRWDLGPEQAGLRLPSARGCSGSAQGISLQVCQDQCGVSGVPGVAQLLGKCLDPAMPGSWVGPEVL